MDNPNVVSICFCRMGMVFIFIRLVFNNIKPVPSESEILMIVHTHFNVRKSHTYHPVRVRRYKTKMNDPVLMQYITYQSKSHVHSPYLHIWLLSCPKCLHLIHNAKMTILLLIISELHSK